MKKALTNFEEGSESRLETTNCVYIKITASVFDYSRVERHESVTKPPRINLYAGDYAPEYIANTGTISQSSPIG